MFVRAFFGNNKYHQMKTKIVYAVVSDEKDVYMEEVFLSTYSLRRHNPDAFVELVVDSKTDATIKGDREKMLKYVNKKTVVNVPGHYNKVQTSRYLKTSLRQTVEGDFLFIDSDTIVTDSLAEADSLTGNVMMVLDYHVSLQQRYNAKSVRRRLKATDVDWSIEMPYYNSGIMYVKDCEESRRLFEVWHEKWKNNVEIAGIHFDQIPLAYANEVTSHLITELDGVWNCQIMNNGLPFLNRAKIIHYFMSFASIRAAKPYRFHDKQLLLDIRKEGDIPTYIADMIDRAKEMFLIPNQIAAGSETALLNNSLYKLYISHPRTYSLFNTIARYILKISGSK